MGYPDHIIPSGLWPAWAQAVYRLWFGVFKKYNSSSSSYTAGRVYKRRCNCRL